MTFTEVLNLRVVRSICPPLRSCKPGLELPLTRLGPLTYRALPLDSEFPLSS